MVVNFNGQIIDQNQPIYSTQNRIVNFGDIVKEVIRVKNGEIHLWENHYFSLMASMRIMRMNIPLNFTPEFFQDQIHLLLEEYEVKNGKIEFVCSRSFSDDLLKSGIDYFIRFSTSDKIWEYENLPAEIDVYKDYYVNDSFFSQNNIVRPEENIAKIYLLENEFDDLVLLNQHKKMARSLNGAIFLINDDIIKTPKLSEGVNKSVLRDHFIAQINQSEKYKVEETDIFPFEMQKAEEIFVLIDGFGLKAFTQNRKKTFRTEKTDSLLQFLD